VPFLDEARRSGGETLVVGPPALADMVRATGHPFLAGGEPSEAQVRPIRERLPVLPPHEASVLGNRELFARLAATAMLAAMEQAVRDWRPDVILRDPCEYASAVVAARLGIPAAQVAISLAEVEWDSIGVAAPALEAHRDGLADELRRSPYLARFPAALDASPFPGTRRYREPAAPRGALPAWWPGTGAPLVYVSFGTVLGHMSFAGEVYRVVIDAVAGLDARVLVTTGHGFDPARLRDVPGNVHVEAWVDQADVLGEAELVVCHGGSGTTYGALAAGVPLVVVPVFADQFANAPKVAQAGVGVQVHTGQDPEGRRRPAGREDTLQIRRAIGTVLADGSYREAARAVAADMAAAPAIGTLLGQLPRRH
jgi:Erythromycin biosynthesis protein CIII-like, C-terminal domain/Erythromycin biosynthesis protein CIII-like, N-terminal domain